MGVRAEWRDTEVFTLQLFLFELLAKQAEAVQILVIPEWWGQKMQLLSEVAASPRGKPHAHQLMLLQLWAHFFFFTGIKQLEDNKEASVSRNQTKQQTANNKTRRFN